MENTTKKGVARKAQKYLTKSTLHPTYPLPTDPRITDRQLGVLQLISKGFNLTRLHRHLNLSKPTIRGHTEALVKKGLLVNQKYILELTKQGKEALETSKVGSKVLKEKNIHKNLYSVTINEFPAIWRPEQGFAKNFFKTQQEPLHNVNSKQMMVYFEDCTIVLHYGVKRIDFHVREQVGTSFDEIKMKVWNIVVFYHALLRELGFNLSFSITSKNPDFANPNGFFAMMARKRTLEGFQIDTDKGSFFVDYSLDDAEEETSSEEMAKRMEALAESAYSSKSDFNDLDSAVSNIDKIIKSIGMITQESAVDLHKTKSLFELQKATQEQMLQTQQQIQQLVQAQALNLNPMNEPDEKLGPTEIKSEPKSLLDRYIG